MLFAPFVGSLVPASVRVEVDALAFEQVVSELAYIHSSVMLRSVFPEVKTETVFLAVAPLTVVAFSIRPFVPAQAVLLSF